MVDAPIDLSRRCDSVETRKTPSPYSSAFSSTSPTFNSPTSSNGSVTPIHYNPTEYMRSRFTLPTTEFESKPESNDYHHHHMHVMPENIPSYMLEMDPMQRKLIAELPVNLPQESKTARPFKAYQENPFLSELLVDENYTQFRDQTLEAIRQQNGGQLTVSNPRMRRVRQKSNETQQSDESMNGGSGPIKDNAYYERRRRNNEAAKKSRDRRRQKEDELALRTTYLEHENMLLRVQLSTIKKQLAQLFEKKAI